ncbi:MAG: tRNA (adenosine(37)-N6)-threonylcarbamoyltransferase complex dimerization subunit type 1 TsaB [Puia sp.]|nr:tRNA (adenosine(37)-N6)-threonylcarbamoyltransferase complex dimerization subunit type 1 TsaB [Puia sp.]
MALILNIDTATETAGICLSREGETLALFQHDEQKDHAAWLQPAIGKMMRETGYNLSDLEAVAVTGGPGSYTGLRVGMATAKGLCYALQIPLIAANTLRVMALAAMEQLPEWTGLLCPMIDARRMDVFTAVYQTDGVTRMLPKAMTVEKGSFDEWLEQGEVSFFGGGSDKCKLVIQSIRAHFVQIRYHAGHLGILSFKLYLQGEFADTIYCEPAYTKEFYTHNRK